MCQNNDNWLPLVTTSATEKVLCFQRIRILRTILIQRQQYIFIFQKKKMKKKGTLAGTLDPRHGILDPRQKDRLNICLQKRHNKLTLTSVIKLDLLTFQ